MLRAEQERGVTQVPVKLSRFEHARLDIQTDSIQHEFSHNGEMTWRSRTFADSLILIKPEVA
jgi:hypothetical protein